MLDSFNVRNLFKRLNSNFVNIKKRLIHFIERMDGEDVEFVYVFIKVIKDPLVQGLQKLSKKRSGVLSIQV